MNDISKLQQIIEGLLLASGKPLSIEQIAAIFSDEERPENQDIREALEAITAACEGRGYELSKVASGYRFQVRKEVGDWVGRLWDEKPQKYSRALLETLAIIAYRQPLTRGDIEKIRGVAVNTQIVRTLQEREWIRVVGHRDVPGRPAMYATTRQFLDYFNLDNLDQLPALAEIRDMDEVRREMNKELSLEAAGHEGRVLDMPQGENPDEVYHVLDEADEAVVAWATQPLSRILGEDKGEEADIPEQEGLLETVENNESATPDGGPDENGPVITEDEDSAQSPAGH